MNKINLFKKNLIFPLFIFLLTINFYSNSNEEITKKYFNNLFGGGKEKIIISEGDIDAIDIYSAIIQINLFDNYSNVSITYKLKNNGKDAKILFAFPRIDAKIKKLINKKNYKSNIIHGDFLNYSILINGHRANYSIKEDNQYELNLPYKIGDYLYQKRIDRNGRNKIINEEIVDSFYYTYSWYISPVSIKQDENKIIKISYTTPHYFNEIKFNNTKNIIEELEDPALMYLSVNDKNSTSYESEKIFIYNFNTSYSDKEKKIDKLLLKVKANIIDQDYLKIMPINYKKRGNNYYWVYKNFKASAINNLLVKISPFHSKDTINPLSFKYTPAKTKDGIKSYFELNKSDNEINLEYKGNKSNFVKFSKIRIFPDYYKSRFDLKNMNKPLLIKLEFSNSPDFLNSKVVIEKIRNKKFIRVVKRRSYVEIYDGKEVTCKYIKIKVLSTSNKNDIVKISDVQILK